MYGIITDTPSENTESCIAYNDLSSDEDEPLSTVQNQLTSPNRNVAQCKNEVNDDKCDMLNDDIENQIDARTQEMVNDDGELIYKYMQCS